MNPKRKQRLYLTLFLLLVASGVTALLIQISGENMNMFYPPADVVSGEAPVGETLRAGGMVREGSVVRSSMTWALPLFLPIIRVLISRSSTPESCLTSFARAKGSWWRAS